MSLLKKDKTRILEPFSSKYKLLVSSKIQVGSNVIESQALIRWLVNVKQITNDKDKMHLELITLENQLIHSNNPMVKEAAAASQAFARMYNELDLIIDSSFNVLKVLNIDVIKNKWNILKSELEELKKNDPQSILNHTIQTNEDILKDPKNIILSIQYNEFFQFWGHHFYDKPVNTYLDKISKKTLLNTAEIEWSYKYHKKTGLKDASQYYILHIDSHLDTKVNKDWAREAYKDFTHLDFKSFEPKFLEEGEYTIDSTTGKVVEAKLIKQEIVSPDLLHATMKYNLSIETNTLNNKVQQI